jgi:PPOX class probable F420-dependent enzyme
MDFQWEHQHRQFLDAHKSGILATGRRDGSPQQSMVAYAVDDEGRLLISAKSYTAKWNNAVRQPRVSMTITEGRIHLVVYGTAETIETDPLRAELTSLVFAALMGAEPPDPTGLIPTLDEQQRTVLRITPDKIIYHE